MVGINRIALISLTVLVMMFTGCTNGGKQYVTIEEYEEVKASTMLDCGLTITELEARMIKLAHKVYNPVKEGDILDGINVIKDITTEEEYRNLVNSTDNFNVGNKAKITRVSSSYSSKANNTDNMDKVILEVQLNLGGKTQNNIVEFVFNDNDQIFKHYVWQGAIKNE